MKQVIVMGKGGKYAASREKRFSLLFVIVAAILILALTGTLLFVKKGLQGKQEVQAPAMQATVPRLMQDMISVDDVEWAQASIWKDSAVHLFLTQQQITDIIHAVKRSSGGRFGLHS